MKIEPDPKSPGSLRDEGSQTPTGGSPTRTLTQPESQNTQRFVTPNENGERLTHYQSLDGAEDSDQSDPADKIEHFDWKKLEERYHDAIAEKNKVEREILDEFNSLMNFFTIWADTSQSHEAERSFKRLRTRMAHVQNSEEKLETTRLHYIQVVKAFESALQLLNKR